jgi:hypothetical protein
MDLTTAWPLRTSIVPTPVAGFTISFCSTDGVDVMVRGASLKSVTTTTSVDPASCSARYRRRDLNNMFALIPSSRASFETETAYSTQNEHPIHTKSNADSTAKRTRIPRHREQTGGSDAGALPFYSVSVVAVNELLVLRIDSPSSVRR